MKYELTIFDFDGTLADSFPWFIRIFNDVAEKYNFRRIEDHEIEALRGLDSRKIIEHLKIPMWKMPFIARHMRKQMARDLNQIFLFPGVDEMLQGIADNGVTIAIVSSNAQANIQAILGSKNACLIKYYSCGSGLFGKARKFKKLIRQSDIPASQTICIGDELRDLHAARSVGAAFGAVSWGYAKPESFISYSPDETFLDISDIAEKLSI